MVRQKRKMASGGIEFKSSQSGQEQYDIAEASQTNRKNIHGTIRFPARFSGAICSAMSLSKSRYWRLRGREFEFTVAK
jgi:hypothetical protein